METIIRRLAAEDGIQLDCYVRSLVYAYNPNVHAITTRALSSIPTHAVARAYRINMLEIELASG